MTLALHKSVAEFRKAANAVRSAGKRLGLVPTMGALHEGHLSLVREARSRTDEVAVTIFVNPTQFGPNEDFARYPRTLDRDLELCRAAGVRHVFAPETSEMYPKGERTRVQVSGLTSALCGPHRPGHFDGVTTIVSKLFAVAGECVAVFGRKDYQQLKVIERMTRDLLLPVEIVGLETLRDADGLALSSRNAYLSSEERARALGIARGLSAAVAAFEAGERLSGELRDAALEQLNQAGLRLDYATIADADELTPISDEARVGDRALLAVAGFMGKTRLIDNVVLGEDPAPIASAKKLGAG
ncbi:MAG TPA: pantoate--beta-alanine ligase [Polyangiaceae bacterium]|jgi:pantoate--beta-alanine ligase|nr:pantoate--beta-alanine ligase [Polyangiaceae bacterium]